MHAADITRTAVIVVGDVLAAEGFADSYLYSSGRARREHGIDAGVLLLGGTAEARALAARLHPGVDVISSLAGRVPDPALPVGEVRIGGFGGVDGMRRWLLESDVDAVVDATHPFAATITATRRRGVRRAADAAPGAGPARVADAGDAIVVGSDIEAAKTVADKGYSRVFLTTGRSGVAAFSGARRVVSDPRRHRARTRRRCRVGTSWCCRADRTATTTSCDLLREHRIDALVTKNSGGDMTRAKLDAAADPRRPGGDGRPAAAARGRRHGVDRRRGRGLGQLAW